MCKPQEFRGAKNTKGIRPQDHSIEHTHPIHTKGEGYPTGSEGERAPRQTSRRTYEQTNIRTYKQTSRRADTPMEFHRCTARFNSSPEEENELTHHPPLILRKKNGFVSTVTSINYGFVKAMCIWWPQNVVKKP